MFDYEAALAGCARRDGDALRRLYDREAPFLLAVAARILRSREAAADAVHDAFVDIWRDASSFDRERGAGRAWVVAVVRHRALRAARLAGREAPIEPAQHEAVADDAPDAFANLAAAQDGSRLHGCLARLEPERRRAVLLAYVDGLSQSEIAARLGAPLGTVKSWTRRALLSLKECLS